MKTSEKKKFFVSIPLVLKQPLSFWILVLIPINVVLLSGFIILIILFQSQSLANIPKENKTINFSYFKSRPDLLTSAKALVVYDVNNDNVLLSKNENLRFSPASTAKIMSALISLENYNPSTVLTYNTVLAGSESSRMGLYVGEQMTVENLLYGMMLPSGNDAARLLAVNFPGGEQEFIRAMNIKAKSIGLTNTYFVDPSGFQDENFSTAYDLARLGAEAVKHKDLAVIVKTPLKTVLNVDGTISHNLKNINELLLIDGVTGIKTGFTNEAEGVLVTSFQQDGETYIIVVLRSENRFQDTKELITGIINDLKNESFSL